MPLERCVSLFELFGLLIALVAILGYLNHRFVGLPDTIGITAIGLAASLGLTLFGAQAPEIVGQARVLAEQINLTEAVFHGLLGTLLFAGSLHVDWTKLTHQRGLIVALATVGVLVSTVATGGLLHLALKLLGVHIDLLHCMLFGALISPTDPIAALGVLKTANAPKPLENAISGESLFNDATGVVAFMVLLGIATGHAQPTVGAIGQLLFQEVFGALGLGLSAGYGVYLMLRTTNSFAVEILLTMALATAGYALAERMHVSAPLAVVVMGLVVGNKCSRDSEQDTRTREHLFMAWDFIDEVLTLILFGLVALKLLALGPDAIAWVLALTAVPVVLVARATSVALPVWALGTRSLLPPHAWKLLTWGGMRGGISVALALSLPAFEGKELLVTSTYVVVLFSLLVQASTLGRMLRRYTPSAS